MTPLRIILCDDEPLALDRLERMLNALPGITVTGKYLSGEALLAGFSGGADLLLLDVEMPRMDALDVIEALGRRDWPEVDQAPLVIFVTAHSQFAVDAFDSGAVDFLTKPVRLSRLELALERARNALADRKARRRLAEIGDQLARLKLREADQEPPHIWVRKGSQRVRIEAADIDWVAAEGEYVRFHCGAESYLERQSISAVERRFAPLGFVRVHRSALVNAARIERLSRTRWGALELHLAGGAKVRVSKSFQPAVRQLLRSGGRGQPPGGG